MGRELSAFHHILDRVLEGIGFDQFLPEFGEVNWPPEEASFLRLSKNIDAVYGNLEIPDIVYHGESPGMGSGARPRSLDLSKTAPGAL